MTNTNQTSQAAPACGMGCQKGSMMVKDVKPLRKITRKEWAAKKRHGYATTIDGVRRVLMQDPDAGGTCSMPVEVEGMKPPKKPTLAYAIHCGPGKDEGRIILIEDGVKGYRPIADYDSSPAARRPGIVDRLNDRLTVSFDYVCRLIAQSMS